MGIISSRFRKKRTTIEVLEDLDTQIKQIQQYGQTTEQRHKKVVGTIVIYGVALYVMIAFIFYFCFFPASLYDQLFYIIPLLLFPILILLTKKMFSWYYNRKITHNREKLFTIIEEKKKILNEVTETETYKKAKEILLKFAPDELNISPFAPKLSETPRHTIPQIAATPLTISNDLRRRVLSTQNQLQNQSQSGQIGVPDTATPGGGPSKQPSNTPHQFRIISPVPAVGFQSPLPRPVLLQQRSVIDRLIDYLVGDGPSNRYALICRQCESHNGMALKEEFEYFAYRCCYCGFWNPARKQKPSAPKLDIDNSMSELLCCDTEKSVKAESDTGKNAAETCREICEVYGENAVSEGRIQEWFALFRSANFDIKDASRSGRPVTEKVDEILQLVEQNRHANCQEIAEALNINYRIVLNYLKRAGYKKKLNVWVPYELTQRNLIDRITISKILLKRNEMEPFLKRIITGDEKWVKYKNIKRKQSCSKADDPLQTTSTPGLSSNKVMLSVWWDWKGIVHYELLQPGETINSVLYCAQLDHLNEAIQKERPELANRKGVVFHHDNARPHTSLMTRNKLTELGWEVLMHPPYSPDFAPSDYHLFRSL